MEDCYFTKNNTPSWLFFTFFKLCKKYRIGQCITYKTVAAKLITVSLTQVIIKIVQRKESQILFLIVNIFLYFERPHASITCIKDLSFKISGTSIYKTERNSKGTRTQNLYFLKFQYITY